MKKCIKGLYLVLLLLLLVGCNSNANNGSGSINGLVLDASTNEAISGVKVSFAGGKTAKTDSQGKVSIKGLGAGEYNLIFEKKGYAKMMHQSSLSLLAERENLVVRNSSIIYYLTKTNKTVYGEVKQSNNNKIEPLKDAELQIAFYGSSSSLFMDVLSVTTDSEGKYTFNNCPEYASYTIVPKDFLLDNKIMSASTVSGTVGVANQANNIIYSVSKTLTNFTVNEINLSNLTETSSIQVKMSGKIDTSKIDKNSIGVTLGGTTLPIKYNFDSTGTILTISSLSGNWPVNSSLYLSLKLYSQNDKDVSYSNSWYFTTTSSSSNNSLGNVTGITMVRQTYLTYYDISWNSLTGATSYEVYYKTNNDTYYTRLTSTSSNYYEYYRSSSSSVTSISIIVVGVNSTYRSNFESAYIYAYNFT